MNERIEHQDTAGTDSEIAVTSTIEAGHAIRTADGIVVLQRPLVILSEERSDGIKVSAPELGIAEYGFGPTEEDAIAELALIFYRQQRALPEDGATPKTEDAPYQLWKLFSAA